jgi:hypothetical protein
MEKVKKGPVWGLEPVRGGGHKERVKEAEYSGNIMYSGYENVKMRPAEDIPRMGGREG